MKFTTREPMVIRGHALERPVAGGLDEAHQSVSAVLRVRPQQAWSEGGEGPAAHGPGDHEPTHVLTTPAPGVAHALAPMGALALDVASESWIPVGRDFDSLRLPPSSGVLMVGVNELGWVVYDWIPGP